MARRGESGINCLIALDKPLGMSSHDVVNRVRRALGERRVGHAGTLDPAASGVLVLGVGQGARLLGLLTAESKTYEARIAFGYETDTEDDEGTPIRHASVAPELHDAGHARDVLRSLVGEHDQIPPAYSAISVGGRRAYDLARSGQGVSLAARRIRINDAELLGIEEGEPLVWSCRLDVSKGSYVRSIARDLGRQLGSAAHLCGLRRVRSGSVFLSQCLPLDELGRRGPDALADCMIDPVTALGLACRGLDVQEVAAAACGRPLSAGKGLAEGERVCLTHANRLVGIWHRSGSLLRCDSNFPGGIAGVAS